MASGAFNTIVTVTLIIDPAGTVPFIRTLIFCPILEQLEELVMFTEHVAAELTTTLGGKII
jgi:hypothetical protein